MYPDRSVYRSGLIHANTRTSCASTHLPPLALAIMGLVKTLVVRNAVLPVDETVEILSVSIRAWQQLLKLEAMNRMTRAVRFSRAHNSLKDSMAGIRGCTHPAIRETVRDTILAIVCERRVR